MQNDMQNANAANRLDRLPISRFHKITLVAVSFAYFFEFADINSFAVTAPRLISLWGVTINQIAYVTSLSFVGMFLGSMVAAWIADRWGRKNALTFTTLASSPSRPSSPGTPCRSAPSAS
jgi:putative MFS transporter